jgi:hypothetical protein
MDDVKIRRCEMSDYDADATGVIFLIYIEISDIRARAEEMHETITNTSWLNSLDIIDRETYKARSRPTIDRIVGDILEKVQSEISDEFGEYMVSDSAQKALCEHLKHARAPLAELIKEKISGNPGFDFHTEASDKIVSFGEAKYSAVSNSYGRALRQINEFIVAKKDIQELTDLRKFFSENSVENAAKGIKSYCAAFSIVSEDTEKIMDNALESDHMPPLRKYEAVYLIGVKVRD